MSLTDSENVTQTAELRDLRPLQNSQFYDCLYRLTDDGSRITPDALDSFLKMTRDVFGEQSQAFAAVFDKASTRQDYDTSLAVFSRLFGNIERNFGNLPPEVMDTIFIACRGFVARREYEGYIPAIHTSPKSEFSNSITRISLMLKSIGIIVARPDIEALVIESSRINPVRLDRKNSGYYGPLFL